MDLAERPIPPAALLALDSRPAILTWRSLAEGGDFSGSAEEYARLVGEAYASGANGRRRARARAARGPVAVRRTASASSCRITRPSASRRTGRRRSRRCARRGARAVKLVAGVADIAGSLRLAELQRGQDGPGVAIFPMGPTSAPGRVLSALFGSRSRLRAGRARDGRRARFPSRDLLEVYEVDRPRTIEALYRRRGREHRAVAVALPPQRDLPLAGPSVSLPAAAGLGLRARKAPRDRVRSAVPGVRGHAALEARGGPRRKALGRRPVDRSVEHARPGSLRLARGKHRRRRGLRSARRPRHRRGADRRRRRGRRRGAGRHRGRAAAGLRGDGGGPAGHGGRPPRRGDGRRFAWPGGTSRRARRTST